MKKSGGGIVQPPTSTSYSSTGRWISIGLQLFMFLIIILFISEYFVLHEQHQTHLLTHLTQPSTKPHHAAVIINVDADNNNNNNNNNNDIQQQQITTNHKDDKEEEEKNSKGEKWKWVLVLTLFSSLASGLGGVPFFFVRDLSPLFISLSNAIASGLMISACVSLVLDGIVYSKLYTLLGIIVGFIFIVISEKVLENFDDPTVGGLHGMDAKKALLFVGVMTIHSFAEGVGMGMSFGGGHHLGVCVSIAIAIHNIPEGIAICLVLLPKGVSPLRSAIWAGLSSIPQPIMALPAYLFVETFLSILPWGLGFASGAMVYMVFSELIPDALESGGDKRIVYAVIVISFMLMTLFQVFLELLVDL